MSQVLVRGLAEEVIERLQRRADGNQRSLEGELREIICAASKQVDVESARRLMEEMQSRLAGRTHGDSAASIRADRDR